MTLVAFEQLVETLARTRSGIAASHPWLSSHHDQRAAAVVEELRADFGVDVDDVEQARVAVAVVAVILAAGVRALTWPPSTQEDAVRIAAAAYDTVGTLGMAVAARHRKEVPSADQ